MFHQAKSYFKFLLKSSSQHGIHSPFVYRLISDCFYDKTRYEDYKKLSGYKTELLQNNSILNITDLGPGSRVSKSNQRKISEIAKHAGSTQKRAQLLYRLQQHFKPNNALELGTSLGIATYAMHLGNPNHKITTIEGCPNISAFTKQQLVSKEAKNIELLNGDFNDVLSTLKQNTFDFIYIDGNHTKEATLQYFETLLNHANNDTTFMFDDIYWSKGMTEAWETLKNHPKVTVTIDCYWCGFVFIRKEQVKQNFTVRLKRLFTNKLIK